MMASYDYDVWIQYQYNSESGNYDQVSATPASGTLDDGETSPAAGAETFESDDTAILDSGTFSAGSYVGTITLNAIEYVVLDMGSGLYNLYAMTGDSENAATNAAESFDPGDIDRSDFSVCFAGGTMIATPGGEVAVETLKIGDRVLTDDGRVVPVLWVGRQTRHRLFTSADRFAPVRIRAGALGRGLPTADLVVTPEHGLVIDGLVIAASALVDGAGVILEPVAALPDRVTYYHLETEAHDTIIANGAAAETFVDYVGRRAFDNFSEYLSLFGEERSLTEMDRPRISARRLVPDAIRERIAAASVFPGERLVG